jgi:hypothetical protein
MTWLESLPPMMIIAGAVAAMGSLQGIIHRGYYGKVRSSFMPGIRRPSLSALAEFVLTMFCFIWRSLI